MSAQKIVVIGAGGLGREVAALIDSLNQAAYTWDLLGFIDDDPSKLGAAVGRHTVLGGRSWLQTHSDVWALIAFGNGETRKKVAAELPFTKWATIVHPSAVAFQSSTPSVGAGTVVFGSSVLSTDVSIGMHSVVYYGSALLHDTSIGDYVTILPGCCVSGNARVESGATLGLGTSVVHNVCVGRGACLGAGSVVVQDVPESCLAVGAPARVKKGSYTAFDFWR